MTYEVYSDNDKLIGEVLATNLLMASELALRKFNLKVTDIYRVQPKREAVDVEAMPVEAPARKTDWLTVGARTSAVVMFAAISFFGGMRVEHDRLAPLIHPVEVKVEEKPKPIITDIGRMTKWEPLENGEGRLTTENAVLYVQGQFPMVWTSQCHLLNDGKKVWFEEDGLPFCYVITRQ